MGDNRIGNTPRSSQWHETNYPGFSVRSKEVKTGQLSGTRRDAGLDHASSLTEEEMLVLLGSKSKEFEKKTVSYRLTAEARRILDVEANRLGVDKTKALEIILREYHRGRGSE